MVFLRSVVFNITYISWTIMLAVLYLPLLLAPQRWMQAGVKLWLAGIVVLARWCVGIRVRIQGREYIPAGAAIIAAKHQSAFETFLFHGVLPQPAYVLKQELLGIPLVGMYMRKAGMVPVDRGAGAAALKHMVAACDAAFQQGVQVIIFPEGTRTAPGEVRKYHPGVAALYSQCRVPVVPVALDSGKVWRRNSFLKRAGTITIQFLPPIPPPDPSMGRVDKKHFMQTLQDKIEQACQSL